MVNDWLVDSRTRRFIEYGDSATTLSEARGLAASAVSRSHRQCLEQSLCRGSVSH